MLLVFILWFNQSNSQKVTNWGDTESDRVQEIGSESVYVRSTIFLVKTYTFSYPRNVCIALNMISSQTTDAEHWEAKMCSLSIKTSMEFFAL